MILGKKYFGLFCYILLLSGSLFAQTPPDSTGKIFDVQTAFASFGAVDSSVAVDVALIDSLANISGTYMMFGIIQGHAVALSGSRNPMLIDNTLIGVDNVFHVYSTEKVKQLLDKVDSGVVLFQKRKNVFSLQYKELILEEGYPCPPYCKE